MPRNHLLQIRRDTAANWTSTNPTLAAGELGLETDTGVVKAGDGSTAWSSLDPINNTTYERPLGVTAGAPIAPSSTNSGSFTASIIGVANDRLYARDASVGRFMQSDDWGATWNNKGLPADTSQADLKKAVEFGGYVYTVLKDTTDNLYKVYRAAVVTGSGTLTWSAALTTLTDTSTHINTRSCFNAGTSYLWLGEYGDPSGGPRILRSADGTTWETSYGRDAATRHVHAVAEDPYNAGHIWATLGDGGSTAAVIKSEDDGDTWETVVASLDWQSVQISFSPKWVWLAGDRIGLTVAVIDRSTGDIYAASPDWHGHHSPVPLSAASDQFYKNAYWGAVDPATESYYCVANDTSAGGNKFGQLWLPGVGHRLSVLEVAPAQGVGEVFIANGKMWSGGHNRPLLAPSAI